MSISSHIRIVAMAGLLVGSAASPVLRAQGSDDVTVLLRSGERVSGRLEDLNGGTLYVRVSPNDQRRIPVSQLVVIDYVGGARGLPDTETSAARGTDHVVVMRNSQLVPGRLVDIEGGVGSDKENDRRVFVFRTTAGEERRIPAEQVGRVYLGEYPGTQAAAPGTGSSSANAAMMPSSASGVRVPANQPWTPTGIRVVEGQLVTFSVQGEAQLSAAPEDRASSAGAASGRRADRAPLPSALAGALIGRVGNGAPFGIGNQSLVPMPGTGELFLGVNDDEVGDNSGGFVVDVKPQAAPRRRR
ncbi:hypothetical protein TBR22_A52400 [Luteitalea sp. TBR-22]|uniref:hypothetical protein n=1 Tax=Luteitalea sp. TBR-22 TaxID=2802971 RepID=UPI001AF7F959|nr:hypothetical protein [Luteitalea sp. TBR-22]BCS36003.1 hypothetical protein TBR22_A52400 [Luteitalea sp. TBR-22]